MSKQANIMLVHGAWADGTCWSKVILLLEAKGFKVTAAQIPLSSLSDDVAVTRLLLSTSKEPTVLVGHSYGGAVITGAATETPQVKLWFTSQRLVWMKVRALNHWQAKVLLRPAPRRLSRTPTAFSGSTGRSFTIRSQAVRPGTKPL